MTKQNDLQLLTAEEAAAYLGITKATLYAYVSQKRFPHYRSTKRIYLDRADLDQYMREHLIYVNTIKQRSNNEK